MSRRELLVAYFVTAGSIYEPERSQERLAWAMTSFLVDSISSLLDQEDHRDNSSQEKRRRALLDALVAHGQDISPAALRRAWEKWMDKWEEEGKRDAGTAELLVEIINMASGRAPLEDLLPPSTFHPLSHLTNTICSLLACYRTQKVEESSGECATTPEIESGMQQLAEMVFRNSSKEDSADLRYIKHTFFNVARSFYYTACCDPATINFHIAKMLFQKVE